MPQPYSLDLRERVLGACVRGDLPQVGLLAVSRSTPPPCRTGAAKNARWADASLNPTASAFSRAWMRCRLRRCVSS
jgi:hypothetical protein